MGGTGLYFKALTEGLAAIPDPPAALTAALRARLQEEGPERLHADLTREDPAAAQRLEPLDGVRIVRALAVKRATGRSILAWRADAPESPPLSAGGWLGLALTPLRSGLYRRIDARFAGMMEAGALQEAGALYARGLDPTLPALKAHGAPWLAAHLAGRMTRQEAIDLSTRDTRRYAKRQMTWIAHQASGFHLVPGEGLNEQERTALGCLEGKNAH